jgi:pheromone a factor receptor
MEFGRWMFVMCALFFFFFFGFASEARRNYMKVLCFFARGVGKEETVKRWMGTTTFTGSTGSGSASSRTGPSLPSFGRRQDRTKRVVGDGLDFDESEFDEKKTRSNALMTNTGTNTMTRSRTDSTVSSFTDIEDEKIMSAASDATAVAPWETVALPQLQTADAASSSSLQKDKVSDAASPV